MLHVIRYSHRLCAVLSVMFDLAYPGNDPITLEQVQKTWTGKEGFVTNVFHRLIKANLITPAEGFDPEKHPINDGKISHDPALHPQRPYHFTKPLKQSVKAWKRGENQHSLLPV